MSPSSQVLINSHVAVLITGQRCLSWILSRTNTGQFDEALIRHQVKYLGLMEHLRVRRAGFAYRRKYDVFLKRYEGPQNSHLMLDFQIKSLSLSSSSKVHLKHDEWVVFCISDINRCARPHGLTGEECLLMEWKCWFSIWATCHTSTKWDGEDVLPKYNTANAL